MSVTFMPYVKVTDEDGEYWTMAPDPLDLSVNVSNANACDILSTVFGESDFSYGICGSLTADEALGAIMVAGAVMPDDPGHEGGSDPRRPNIIHCGRRPGYLNDRVSRLRTLAEYCKREGYHFGWS